MLSSRRDACIRHACTHCIKTPAALCQLFCPTLPLHNRNKTHQQKPDDTPPRPPAESHDSRQRNPAVGPRTRSLSSAMTDCVSTAGFFPPPMFLELQRTLTKGP